MNAIRLMNGYLSSSCIESDCSLCTQICSKLKGSQCSYFERRDEARPPNNSATTPVKNDTKPTDNLSTAQAATGATYEQKSQQPSLTGLPCECNLASVQRTITEGTNEGRSFWVSFDQSITFIIIRDIRYNHDFSLFVFSFSFLFSCFSFLGLCSTIWK